MTGPQPEMPQVPDMQQGNEMPQVPDIPQGPDMPQVPDMQQLMVSAQKMQAQLLAAQQELAAAEVEGTAGGGLVTAKVTGSGEVLSVGISPEAVDPDDVETLEDLVVAAIRDATSRAQELQQSAMGPLAGGLGGLGLPGM